MRWINWIVLAACVVFAGLPGAAEDWPPVPEAGLAELAVADFSDQELVIPFYLAHFARLANSVESAGEHRGFITLPVWRPKKYNKPFNARVLENHVTFAYFYCTDRRWNPYYNAPAVRVRLEAILDFWCRSQNADGWFSEYKAGGWNLPATGFGVMFMGETLRLLHKGPEIDTEVHQRTIAAQRKAIEALLASEALFNAGRSCSNQYSALWGGILAYLDVYPDADLRTRLRNRLADSLEAHQSPAGYWYEAGGCDWPYTLRTHAGNLLMAWHYARGTDLAPLFVAGQERWAEWRAYNSVPEPDGKTFVLNRAIETRTPGGYVTRHDPISEEVPLMRAFMLTDEEMAERRVAKRRELEANWPEVPELEVGEDHAYSPHPILNLKHRRWYPAAAQRRAAIASVPCLARHTYNHQRADGRAPQTYTFVRRPAYYAVFNTGNKLTGHQRFGLGLVWTPEAGVVMQSQSASNDAAWGTQRQDAKSVYETELRSAEFSVRGSRLTPEPGARDLPPGDVTVAYALGSAGRKVVTLSDDGIAVRVAHAGLFVERIPLLAPADGGVRCEGSAVRVTAGDGSVVWILEFEGGTAPALEETEYTVAAKKVVIAVCNGEDELLYRMHAGS